MSILFLGFIVIMIVGLIVNHKIKKEQIDKSINYQLSQDSNTSQDSDTSQQSSDDDSI